MTMSSQLVNDKQTLKDRWEKSSSSLSLSLGQLSSSLSNMAARTYGGAKNSANSHRKREKENDTSSSFKSSTSALSKSANLSLTIVTDDSVEVVHETEGADAKQSKWLKSYQKKKSIYLSAYNKETQ